MLPHKADSSGTQPTPRLAGPPRPSHVPSYPLHPTDAALPPARVPAPLQPSDITSHAFVASQQDAATGVGLTPAPSGFRRPASARVIHSSAGDTYLYAANAAALSQVANGSQPESDDNPRRSFKPLRPPVAATDRSNAFATDGSRVRKFFATRPATARSTVPAAKASAPPATPSNDSNDTEECVCGRPECATCSPPAPALVRPTLGPFLAAHGLLTVPREYHVFGPRFAATTAATAAATAATAAAATAAAATAAAVTAEVHSLKDDVAVSSVDKQNEDGDVDIASVGATATAPTLPNHENESETEHIDPVLGGMCFLEYLGDWALATLDASLLRQSRSQSDTSSHADSSAALRGLRAVLSAAAAAFLGPAPTATPGEDNDVDPGTLTATSKTAQEDGCGVFTGNLTAAAVAITDVTARLVLLCANDSAESSDKTEKEQLTTFGEWLCTSAMANFATPVSMTRDCSGGDSAARAVSAVCATGAAWAGALAPALATALDVTGWRAQTASESQSHRNWAVLPLSPFVGAALKQELACGTATPEHDAVDASAAGTADAEPRLALARLLPVLRLLTDVASAPPRLWAGLAAAVATALSTAVPAAVAAAVSADFDSASVRVLRDAVAIVNALAVAATRAPGASLQWALLLALITARPLSHVVSAHKAHTNVAADALAAVATAATAAAVGFPALPTHALLPRAVTGLLLSHAVALTLAAAPATSRAVGHLPPLVAALLPTVSLALTTGDPAAACAGAAPAAAAAATATARAASVAAALVGRPWRSWRAALAAAFTSGENSAAVSPGDAIRSEAEAAMMLVATLLPPEALDWLLAIGDGCACCDGNGVAHNWTRDGVLATSTSAAVCDCYWDEGGVTNAVQSPALPFLPFSPLEASDREWLHNALAASAGPVAAPSLTAAASTEAPEAAAVHTAVAVELVTALRAAATTAAARAQRRCACELWAALRGGAVTALAGKAPQLDYAVQYAAGLIETGSNGMSVVDMDALQRSARQLCEAPWETAHSYLAPHSALPTRAAAAAVAAIAAVAELAAAAASAAALAPSASATPFDAASVSQSKSPRSNSDFGDSALPNATAVRSLLQPPPRRFDSSPLPPAQAALSATFVGPRLTAAAHAARAAAAAAVERTAAASAALRARVELERARAQSEALAHARTARVAPAVTVGHEDMLVLAESIAATDSSEGKSDGDDDMRAVSTGDGARDGESDESCSTAPYA